MNDYVTYILSYAQKFQAYREGKLSPKPMVMGDSIRNTTPTPAHAPDYQRVKENISLIFIFSTFSNPLVNKRGKTKETLRVNTSWTVFFLSNMNS